jgi:hypothetical protein
MRRLTKMAKPRRSRAALRHGERKAATYFYSLREPHNHNVHMITEDIANGIMPILIRRDSGNKYRAEIKGEKDAREKVTILLQSFGGLQGHSPEELVAGAIREVARSVSQLGFAPFEIIRSPEDQNEIHLVGFTPQRLVPLPTTYIQIVPRGDRETWGRRFILLSRKTVWSVSMPRTLGGRRGYRRMLAKLSHFASVTPPFIQKRLGSPNAFATFDVTTYRREADIYHSRACKLWGWNRRDFTQRNWTEFAQFYRTITFIWAKAILRDHILAELNSLFRRLGIDAELFVSGLPSPDEVLRLRSEMVEGAISYSAAFKAADFH